MPADPDHELRQAAHAHAQYLSRAYDDLIPRAVLLEGFRFMGQRVSLGSFHAAFTAPASSAVPPR